MVKTTVRIQTSRVEFAEGELQLIGEDGQVIDLTGKPAISLCRCGGSLAKPFRDGTHSRTGFQGAERAVVDAQKQEPPK
jgi:CDGSH-type Zn-finger protein